MSPLLKLLLEGTAAAILILIVYNVLRVYVLSKLKINKWVVLTLAIAAFIFTVFVAPIAFDVNKYGIFGQLFLSGIFAMLFFWFWDLQFPRKDRRNNISSKASGKSKKNDIIIKPKAKPNRVRNKED